VEDTEEIWGEFMNDPTIRITESRSKGLVRYARYRERGERCQNEGLFARGPYYVYRLLAQCLKEKSDEYAFWLRMLRGFTVYPASDPRSRR
jgi:hypothetical protein